MEQGQADGRCEPGDAAHPGRARAAAGGRHALAEAGCLPGAMFRNLDYVENQTRFAPWLDYSLKMLLLDPQTSGGLCFGVAFEQAQAALERLRDAGYAAAAIIGETIARQDYSIEVIR